MTGEVVGDVGIFEQDLRPLVKKFFPEMAPGSSMESPQAYEERQYASMVAMFNQWVGEIFEGVSYFGEFGEESVKQKLRQLGDQEKSIALAAKMYEGDEEMQVMAHPLGITGEEIDALYKLTCSKQLEDWSLARKLYMALIFLNFSDVRFWLGLAYTYAKAGEVESASQVYGVALHIGGDDPIPYLYFAKFLKLQNDPVADVAIQEGIKRASLDPERYASTLAEFNAL